MTKEDEHAKAHTVKHTKTSDGPPVSGVRLKGLRWLSRKLETPMLILSFVWLIDIVAELVMGMNPFLLILGTLLWTLFIFYFVLRLSLAPSRRIFLKRNWVFVLAILVLILRFVPYFQTIPYVRALTATFGVQVIWIFASAHLALRSLRRRMGRRGAGYAIIFAVVVLIAGAAGILHFERDSPNPQGIHSYPKALWWVAMQITNIGSGYQPTTPGGLIVCLGISIFAVAIFGYLTAIFATIIIGKDAEDPRTEIPNQASILQLSGEVALLRKSMEEILQSLNGKLDVLSGKPPLAPGEDHPNQGAFDTATETI
jgi:voltage-gated potassium channel